MKTPVAIVGSGNIGTDLMMKLLPSSTLELVALVGIDPASDGLARARSLDIDALHTGLEGLTQHPRWPEIRIVFDATSARAHRAHAPLLERHGKVAVDLTPAAVGPYVVPIANLHEHLDAPNVNMVTCGGQATIPIVWAISEVGAVPYAEIVASISSRSAGLGTRANIDEFTQTTARGIEEIGRAQRGKAIIVLNPAEPPLIMRDTVFALCESDDEAALTASIEAAVSRVAEYVPGYRMVQPPVFERITEPVRIPGVGPRTGTQVSVFLEVEGAGHYLPRYAGNLDIMTSAALRVGEEIAHRER